MHLSHNSVVFISVFCLSFSEGAMKEVILKIIMLRKEIGTKTNPREGLLLSSYTLCITSTATPLKGSTGFARVQRL